MKKSFAVFTVAAVLAVFLSSSSMAAWGDGAGGGKGGPSFCKGKIARQLNLTQDQTSKALEKEQAVERDALARRQENEKLRAEMGQELKKDNPDKNKLNKYLEQINKNRTENQKKKLEYMLWFKSQLTPEQKQKLDSLSNGKRAGREKAKGLRREQQGR